MRWFASLRRRRAGLRAALADPRRYEQQIDRLYERHLFDGGLSTIQQSDVRLATAAMHRGKLAKLLARTVDSGSYESQPATIRTIKVDGKQRRVFRMPMLDLIVHAVVADLLTDALEPTLSDRLYSYRRGTSWADAVFALADHVREHRRARPDARQRGLYVLRRDVDAYTDSIPVGDDSRLWALLAEILGIRFPGEPVGEAEHRLIADVVRPSVQDPDGSVARLQRGVPTGQPIASVCFNLYLREIDRELESIPDGFYARYSDDLIFAHPSAAVARGVAELLDQRMAGLDLAFDVEKRRDLYLTGAGHRSMEWPETVGTTGVPFLGTVVHMDGTVALGRRKTRALLHEIRHRVRNADRALDGADLDRRGRAICGVVGGALRPRPSELQQAAAAHLAGVVTDRQQLRHLDYLLARMVAETVSGETGGRAFRQVPYRRIRSDWGLPSLVRSRDRATQRGALWTR